VENKEIELKNFEDEYMIKVKGGKYIPSFSNELKEVFDIEVCKYPTTQLMWLEVMENVKKEDIVLAANTLKLQSMYFMEGK